MDSAHHDRAFVVTFSVVIGILAAIALVLLGLARHIAGEHELPNPYLAQNVDARTKPVATVVTNAAALASTSAPAAHKAMSGKQLVAKVCSACHGTGALGAPKIGDKADWGKRKSQAGGIDGLVKVALSGKGNMPPRGGDASLSKAEIKAAISYMLSKSGL